MSNYNIGKLPDLLAKSTPTRLAQDGIIEQAETLTEQLEISQEENNGLIEQVQLAATERLLLEAKLAEIKKLLDQLGEDRQVLVEECYAAEAELQQLVKRRHKSQRSFATLHQQLAKEESDQRQTNRELTCENRQLVTEGARLKLLKQDLEERNLGLVEDINLLEEVAGELEAHAGELKATAALLRQKNTQLRQQNRALRARQDEKLQ